MLSELERDRKETIKKITRNHLIILLARLDRFTLETCRKSVIKIIVFSQNPGDGVLYYLIKVKSNRKTTKNVYLAQV